VAPDPTISRIAATPSLWGTLPGATQRPRLMAFFAPRFVSGATMFEHMAAFNGQLWECAAQIASARLLAFAPHQHSLAFGVLQPTIGNCASEEKSCSVCQWLALQVQSVVGLICCCFFLRSAFVHSGMLAQLASICSCDDSFLVSRCAICELSVQLYACAHEFVFFVFDRSMYQTTLIQCELSLYRTFETLTLIPFPRGIRSQGEQAPRHTECPSLFV
jgi:hypothetical protein